MRPLLIINDHKKIEEAYQASEDYLKNHESLVDEIAAYLWAYNEAGTLVPQTVENFWSGHFFPFAESYYELENSFELCRQGFYRHSLFALRCALELSVIGLYFDKEDQAHIRIQEWLHSKDPTPFFRNALRDLFSSGYFKQFDEILPIRENLEEFYSVLSNYVHVRGYRYSTTGQSWSNFNRFNERALIRYAQLMKKTVRSNIIMMLLKYPIGMQQLPIWDKFGFNSPIGGILDESSQEAVLNVLDDSTRALLQDISNSDPDTKAIVESILAMPDLTDGELEKQRAELDESMKEHRSK
jgi:hypothetical protein